jgi:predicted TPR repeat methyltransferase
MNDSMAQARQHFLDGVVHFEASRLTDAERSFEAALALAPGRASVLANLGAARVRLGKFADALPVLEQAVAAEPGHADAWGHLGTACAETGHMEDALKAFDRALQINPDLTEGWSRLGGVLRELGQLEEAAGCFERAIALGADDDLHRYYLASVRGGSTPPAPPREYVETLFDSYADDFQGHLTGALRYQAHEVLVRHLPAPPAARGRWRSVLDLGCGTGLCGPLVRGRADRLEGVDLSARMLAQAGASGAYDALFQAEIGAWLSGALRQDDLVLAADVFIYVGALESVFASVARVLAPGGTFAFSVEEWTGGDGLRLMPSLRYAHSEAYVRRLAAAHGLQVLNTVRAPIREDQRRPIDGLYVYLAGPGGGG